jgi:uncharacterized protein YndB with AHSA1/START domain
VSSFSVAREVRAPAEEVWDLLVDWPRHAAWVPLTTMTVDEAGSHTVGSRLVGRTAIGPVGFDDVMRVVAWRPPAGRATGRVEVVHEGRVLGGSAQLEVRPVTAARCVATWSEDLQILPGAPRSVGKLLAVAGAPATALAGRLVFGRVLRRAADQAEQAHAIAVAERAQARQARP